MANITFFYFSGTGNTKILVDIISDFFKKKNYNTTIHPIERYDIKSHKYKNDEIIGFFMPVAVFLTYPFIKDFIKNVPLANKNKCFVITSLGGASFFLQDYLKSILIKKNFTPILYKEIIMPDNYFLSKKDTYIRDKNKINLAKSIANTLAYKLERLINYPILVGISSKWRSFSFCSNIINFINNIIFKLMSKKTSYIKLDSTKCTKCGLCIKICPTNNIALNPYPMFNKTCVRCARCYNHCPTGALFRKHGEKKYKSLNIENILN